MVANTTPCTPLYEPGAPPPPLPLLTAQTDLLDNPFRPTTLVNTEILPKGGPTPRANANPARVKQVAHLRHRSLTSLTSLSSSDSDSDASDSDESSASESSTDSADGTIPKPPGEPGRPGRGGYTLEDALDWNPKAFKKLKVQQLQKNSIVSNRVPQTLVYDLINDHLDTTKCYSGQSLQSLRVVCDMTADKFPDVDGYCGRWPVTDLIKMRLKNTSSKHRKLLEKIAAGKIGRQDMGVRLKSKKSKKVARTKSKTA